MKVWHQSLTCLEALPTYSKALSDHFMEIASNDEVEIHGMARETYPSRYPGSRISSVYLQSLQKGQFVDAALEAEVSGYDAMIIATIPDLALEDCRSVVDIPIVGFGQASLYAAGFLGTCVGIVSFDGSGLEPQLRRNAVHYGVGSRLGPVITIEVTFDEIVDSLDSLGPVDRVVSAFMAGAKRAVDAGADVIVPGAGPLNLFVARQGIRRIGDVPVLDSLHCAIEAARSLVEYASRGVFATRASFFWRRAHPDDVVAARRTYKAVALESASSPFDTGLRHGAKNRPT